MTPPGDRVHLALDTASDQLSVAASRPGGVPALREAAGARRHAQLLAPLVLETLAEVGASPGDVTDVVLADGPGSFTGLRVGAAFAKGLVRARGPSLWVVSTLLARAWTAARVRPGSRIVAGIGSALRGELYLAVYRMSGQEAERGGPCRQVEPLVLPAIVAPAGPLPWPAETLDAIGADLPAPSLAAWPWVRGVPVVPPAGAGVLLDLLECRTGVELVAQPDRWEPTYGRPAEAQARWERAHGKRLDHSPGRA